MKHTLKISLLLIILFFLTQLIGLFITNSYLEKELPYNLARPEINQEKPIQSASAIFLIILIGTIIVLFFARFNLGFLWKIWFFLGVVFTLSISFSSIFSQKGSTYSRSESEIWNIPPRCLKHICFRT